jgi:uncharacterized protein with beta-barrel porin domain
LIDGTTNSGIYNDGTIGDLVNSGTGTISGGKFGIDNDSTITSLSNSGLIDGTTNSGIYNDGTIGSLVNSGTIYGIDNEHKIGRISNAGLIADVLLNDGTIGGSSTIAIANTGTIAHLSNTGLIAGGAYTGISNSGTMTALTNAADGTISGAEGIDNSGFIGQLTNAGLITAGTFGGSDGIANDGSITNLVNSGTILATATYSSAIDNDSDGTISTLSNSGLLSATRGAAVQNDGTIVSFSNTSTIVSTSTIYGAIDNGGTISTLNNAGLISNSSYAGVYTDGTIGSLTNASNGTISGGDVGILNEGTITTLLNAGTITGGVGIVNGSDFDVLSEDSISISGSISTLINPVTISGNTDFVKVVLLLAPSASDTIDTLSNTGTIIGTDGAGIVNTGTINSLINAASGWIKSTSSDEGISNSGTIGSLVNHGTITGLTAIDNRNGTISNGITNTGMLDGLVKLGSANLTLQGTTARVTGDVTGTGAVFVGSGTNAAYFTTEADFTVSGGMTVNGNATLALHDGVQIVASALVNNGKLFIDSGTGTFNGHVATVTGNYTQTGVLSIGAQSASNYGQLTVSGAAYLSETASFDVDVKNAHTLQVGGTLSNVLAASTFTGTTATGMEVTDNSYLLNFEAVQDGNTVDLNILRGSIEQAAKDAGFVPGTGAGGALDQIAASCDEDSEQSICDSRLAEYIDTLNSGTSLGAVVTGLADALPLMQTGMQQSLLGAQQQVTNVIDGRQTGQSSGDGWLTQRQVWFKPLASRIDQNNVNGVAGYKANTAGFVLGAEGSMDATNRLGLALAYTNTRVKGRTSTFTHDAKFDGYQLIAYGTSGVNVFETPVDLNWQADVGFGTTKGHRSAFNGIAYADYKSQSVHVGAGLSRVMDMGDGTSVTPSIRADYTSLRDKAYTETGSGALTLHVNKRTTDQFIVSANAKLSKPLNTEWLFSGNAGLGVDLINETSQLTSRFTGGGPLFSTTGIKPKAWIGYMGLSLQYKPSETTSMQFGYDLSTRSSYLDQTISVKFKWAF